MCEGKIKTFLFVSYISEFLFYSFPRLAYLEAVYLMRKHKIHYRLYPQGMVFCRDVLECCPHGVHPDETADAEGAREQP